MYLSFLKWTSLFSWHIQHNANLQTTHMEKLAFALLSFPPLFSLPLSSPLLWFLPELALVPVQNEN